ncbi:MAG: PoNe immunity protein domain-containing protein [Maribacter stanieri]
MRDTLISDLSYYNDFIKLQNQLLSESYYRLDNNQIPADNISRVHHRLFFKKLEIFIASYGRGDSIKELHEKFNKIFENINKEWEDEATKFKKGKMQTSYDQYWLNSYCYMVWVLSISILLGVDSHKINILTRLIEKGNIKDELILFLLSGLNGKTYLEKKKTTYNPFKNLVKTDLTILDKSSLNMYLKSWYKNTKLLTWHNYIKSTPEKHFYFGYWSFETSAIVALLNIDDSAFKEHENYPYDLVVKYRERTRS